MFTAQRKLDLDFTPDDDGDFALFNNSVDSGPPGEDSLMDHLLTSSPISRRLLQSPRKVRRHVHVAFEAMTEASGENTHTFKIPGISTNVAPPSNTLPPSVPLTYSPPYKRVRSLRLFDNDPATPKTVYQKSAFINSVTSDRELAEFRSRLFPALSETTGIKVEKPVANTNPFSPAELIRIRKRKRNMNSPMMSHNNSVLSSDDGLTQDDEDVPVHAKRLTLSESNMSRYRQEFHELQLIGEGAFGTVHKCIKRLDGVLYAIKKSSKPLAGSYEEMRALNEVYAHAVLGSHRNVVRYFSAWAEENHMFIQNEYCGGGSLAEKLKEYKASGKQPPGLSEDELCKVLYHIAQGLHYIHQHGLVHLDIKPGNIFIANEPHIVPVKLLDNSGDASLEELEAQESPEEKLALTVYKIGDLGHVTSLDDPNVEEGDCRYLPKEIIAEDFTHLTKADIFSLGLTAFEAVSGEELPKNGEVWHAYRDGLLPDIPHINPGLNKLLKWMVHPVASERPSASQIFNHRQVAPPSTLTLPNPELLELREETKLIKLRNEVLERQLEDVKELMNEKPLGRSNKRLVGLKTKRSMSTTTF